MNENIQNCNYVKYCKNISLSNYQMFCYANNKEADGRLLKPFRIFNKELTEEKYHYYRLLIDEILDNDSANAFGSEIPNDKYYWLSDESIIRLSKLEIFDKEVFTNITNKEIPNRIVSYERLQTISDRMILIARAYLPADTIVNIDIYCPNQSSFSSYLSL